MRIKCITEIDKNKNMKRWLTVGKEYDVFSVIFNYGAPASIYYRIQSDEYDRIALFPSVFFEITCNKLSSSWVIIQDSCTDYSLIPKDWTEDGFWELYYDYDDPRTVALVERNIQFIKEENINYLREYD